MASPTSTKLWLPQNRAVSVSPRVLPRSFEAVSAFAGLVSLISCAALPAPPPEAEVRYVEIQERIAPRDLYAYVGQEIRWQNLRQAPVKIGLLSDKVFDRTNCEQGFARLGLLEDFVTIEPGEYVSLCFKDPGIIRYNIWFDAADPRGAISRTGAIHLDKFV